MQPKHPLLGLPRPLRGRPRPRGSRADGQLRAAYPRSRRDPGGYRRRRREVRWRERPRLLHRGARVRGAVHTEGGDGLAVGAAPKTTGVEDGLDEDERGGWCPALPAAGGEPGEFGGVGFPDTRAMSLMNEGGNEQRREVDDDCRE